MFSKRKCCIGVDLRENFARIAVAEKTDRIKIICLDEIENINSSEALMKIRCHLKSRFKKLRAATAIKPEDLQTALFSVPSNFSPEDIQAQFNMVAEKELVQPTKDLLIDYECTGIGDDLASIRGLAIQKQLANEKINVIDRFAKLVILEPEVSALHRLLNHYQKTPGNHLLLDINPQQISVVFANQEKYHFFKKIAINADNLAQEVENNLHMIKSEIDAQYFQTPIENILISGELATDEITAHFIAACFPQNKALLSDQIEKTFKNSDQFALAIGLSIGHTL